MKFYLSIILTMAMLNFVSCTKEEETKTAIANGIVSFKMNSSDWNSSSYEDFLFLESDTIYGVSASFENDILSLSAMRKFDTSGFGLELVLTPNRTGTYNGSNTVGSSEYVLYSPKLNKNTISTLLNKYNITYSVIITKLDLTNKMVSGVFTINQEDPSKINPLGDFKITDGSFTDVKLIVN